MSEITITNLPVSKVQEKIFPAIRPEDSRFSQQKPTITASNRPLKHENLSHFLFC
jgi:hypothetical protein